ncbi:MULTISPECIES: hypothetical protein [unclassified Paenibacillus]|uniref:hypothetical protein n=1 Tax=unclassified Paenibacillus TaxID=185978 RepID=UPI002406CA33|nr:MULTISPECIES: hypothetical protein [unclassified Paenibacillus]MDF9840786.1 hypothetical protein [Paenibacillus sp. PastF-2]MDF9847369.1 hypothetical protein [Paenibacillus sp. PastM-2]MDF9854053.1 hypothetical protein [Paenibacillus sp. PastF-1]MDH6479326.1 hypothetical protein [Paenibacillus sp. PastH-2]MDH6506941.1 hypothetical protein [Paenibacillus sp. PastM-3]
MGGWIHSALSVTGTQGGTLSSAGPVVYINGEAAADGSILGIGNWVRTSLASGTKASG